MSNCIYPGYTSIDRDIPTIEEMKRMIEILKVISSPVTAMMFNNLEEKYLELDKI